MLGLPLFNNLFLNKLNEGFQSGGNDSTEKNSEDNTSNLRRKVEKLKSELDENSEKLKKCTNGKEIVEYNNNIKKLDNKINELKSRLTDETSNKGTNTCKKLSDYKLEDHPDFKKLGLHQPCKGCNLSKGPNAQKQKALDKQKKQQSVNKAREVFNTNAKNKIKNDKEKQKQLAEAAKKKVSTEAAKKKVSTEAAKKKASAEASKKKASSKKKQ